MPQPIRARRSHSSPNIRQLRTGEPRTFHFHFYFYFYFYFYFRLRVGNARTRSLPTRCIRCDLCTVTGTQVHVRFRRRVTESGRGDTHPIRIIQGRPQRQEGDYRYQRCTDARPARNAPSVLLRRLRTSARSVPASRYPTAAAMAPMDIDVSRSKNVASSRRT
jgi:hypothetical protein